MSEAINRTGQKKTFKMVLTICILNYVSIKKDILLMFTMLSSILKVFNKLKWKVCNVKQTLFSIREFFFFL